MDVSFYNIMLGYYFYSSFFLSPSFSPFVPRDKSVFLVNVGEVLSIHGLTSSSCLAMNEVAASAGKAVMGCYI